MVGGILLFALALSFASAQIDLPPSGYRFTSEGTDDYVLDLATPLGVSATDIDAAFQRRANGRIYLVKGLDVWSLPDPVYTALGVQNGLGGVNPPRFSIYEYWPNLATSLPSPITKIDDFLEAIDGTLYIFAGNYVFQYKDDLVVGSLSGDDVTITPMVAPRSNSWSEYMPPRRIAHVFTDLPSSIDASVQLNNGFFYFFKDASYYRAPDRSIYGPTRTTAELVEPTRVEGCYPKAISAGWDITKPISAAFRSISSRYLVFIHADGTTTTIKEKYLDTAPHKEVEYLASAPLTDNITVSCVNQTALDPADAAALTGAYDAIFQRRNGKIYIFIGNMYYRLTDRTHTPYPWDCLDEGYPKLITDSFDFPAGTDFTVTPIDAAFQRSNGKLYFFVRDGYFRFSDKYLDDASDFTGKDVLDYSRSISNFGFTTDPTVGGANPISSVYQKVNGKIYFFFEDNTVYRLDDKYLTTGANDHLDEQYEAGTVTFLDEFYSAPWDLATGPIRNVYQRVETSQKIHVLGGAAVGAVQNEALYFDQTLQWIEPCTACKKDPLATD